MTELTPRDRFTVQATLSGITAADMPRITEIHTVALGEAQRRRTELLRELDGVDRAIAMRSFALLVLSAGAS